MFPEHAVKAYAEVDGQVFQVMARGVAGGCRAQVMGRGCGRVRRHETTPTLLGEHT